MVVSIQLWIDFINATLDTSPVLLRQAFSVIMYDCLPILTDFISLVYLGKLIHPYPVRPPQILPELQACLLAPPLGLYHGQPASLTHPT